MSGILFGSVKPEHFRSNHLLHKSQHIYSDSSSPCTCPHFGHSASLSLSEPADSLSFLGHEIDKFASVSPTILVFLSFFDTFGLSMFSSVLRSHSASFHCPYSLLASFLLFFFSSSALCSSFSIFTCFFIFSFFKNLVFIMHCALEVSPLHFFIFCVFSFLEPAPHSSDWLQIQMCLFLHIQR